MGVEHGVEPFVLRLDVSPERGVRQGVRCSGTRWAPIAGTFLAVWLAHTAYGLPFAIYLLRNFMGSLPREVFESAAIRRSQRSDQLLPAGAADERIYISVVNPDNLPLTVSIAGLVSSQVAGIEFLGAAAFISMALPLIVFFSLQRFFVRGIVGGSVKG